jgi:hypothetical protein
MGGTGGFVGVAAFGVWVFFGLRFSRRTLSLDMTAPTDWTRMGWLTPSARRHITATTDEDRQTMVPITSWVLPLRRSYAQDSGFATRHASLAYRSRHRFLPVVSGASSTRAGVAMRRDPFMFRRP